MTLLPGIGALKTTFLPVFGRELQPEGCRGRPALDVEGSSISQWKGLTSPQRNRGFERKARRDGESGVTATPVNEHLEQPLQGPAAGNRRPELFRAAEISAEGAVL